MATLQSAQAKWERKTAGAGGRWKAGTQGAGGRWAAGMGQFLGSSVGGQHVGAYEAGVNAVSASDFEQSIAGKGSKWAENLRRAFS